MIQTPSQDLDPGKLVWFTSCREDVINPSFLLVLFVVLVPDSTIFATDHGVVESVTGSFQWNTPIRNK